MGFPEQSQDRFPRHDARKDRYFVVWVIMDRRAGTGVGGVACQFSARDSSGYTYFRDDSVRVSRKFRGMSGIGVQYLWQNARYRAEKAAQAMDPSYWVRDLGLEGVVGEHSEFAFFQVWKTGVEGPVGKRYDVIDCFYRGREYKSSKGLRKYFWASGDGEEFELVWQPDKPEYEDGQGLLLRGGGEPIRELNPFYKKFQKFGDRYTELPDWWREHVETMNSRPVGLGRREGKVQERNLPGYWGEFRKGLRGVSADDLIRPKPPKNKSNV